MMKLALVATLVLSHAASAAPAPVMTSRAPILKTPQGRALEKAAHGINPWNDVNWGKAANMFVTGNCVKVTLAFDDTMAGRPTSAMPFHAMTLTPRPDDARYLAWLATDEGKRDMPGFDSTQPWVKGLQYTYANAHPGKTFSNQVSMATITRKLRALGPGARALVLESGHTVNAVNLDGHVLIVDAQGQEVGARVQTPGEWTRTRAGRTYQFMITSAGGPLPVDSAQGRRDLDRAFAGNETPSPAAVTKLVGPH